MEGYKSTISDFIKELLFLLLIFSIHVITACASLYWFTFNFSLADLFIWSMQCLLPISISNFAGFKSLHFGLFWKFSLWSFSVTKYWFWLHCSILSSRLRSFAIAFASVFIEFIADTAVFLYVLLIMFSISNLLYSSDVVSYKFSQLVLIILGFFLYFSHHSCIWRLDFTYLHSIFWTMLYKSNWFKFPFFRGVLTDLNSKLVATSLLYSHCLSKKNAFHLILSIKLSTF